MAGRQALRQKREKAKDMERNCGQAASGKRTRHPLMTVTLDGHGLFKAYQAGPLAPFLILQKSKICFFPRFCVSTEASQSLYVNACIAFNYKANETPQQRRKASSSSHLCPLTFVLRVTVSVTIKANKKGKAPSSILLYTTTENKNRVIRGKGF